MKKILVLGGNGMAGHMITKYLEESNLYEVKNLCHKNKFNRESFVCDLLNIEQLKNILNEFNPDIIVNAIGILNDKSEINIPYTFYINTIIPMWLENYYRNSTCKIIQISTDCVFDGSKGNYSEMDEKSENNIYGLSKNFGEIINSKDLTIRTSIIGPQLYDGKGLFDWFMKQDKVYGYSNVYYSGITTLELAKVIDEAIKQDIHGLYNITSDKKISKYDLLLLIKKIFNKDIIILKDSTKVSDKSLISNKNNFDYKFKDYETMLYELKEWMEKHLVLYQKYYPEKIQEKVIIIWSKIKTEQFQNEIDAKNWLKHRIKIFMNYTCKSFKNQTNQNFIYLINYDDSSKKYLFEELEKYDKLPKNIIFTEHYHNEIKKIIQNYKYLYLVRIDSDDMYQKDFIQKLIDYKPKENTEALIAQDGYIFDVNNGKLGHWFYKSPPFYTLIYNSRYFSNGYRYNVHGHSSIINLNNEIINGKNFVVIIHGENTVSKFYSSFQKGEIIDSIEKGKVLKELNLKMIDK